jgi:hydrogenase expression/formation protein HypC
MRVVSVDGTEIVVEIDGVRREASAMILDEEVRIGEFVIVHAGFAIAKLDEVEALETLKLMREAFLPENMG